MNESDVPPHGSASRYRWHECRCDVCVFEQRKRERESRVVPDQRVFATEEAQLRDRVARERLRVADERAEQAKPAADRHRLTLKQREAARLWGEGYSFREITVEMGLSGGSHSTVAYHVHQAQRKLGVVSSGRPSKDRRVLRAALAGVPIERKEAA